MSSRTLHVEVSGLLGHFNHQFSLRADQPFMILHGPNGVGKTHTLQILERVAQKNIAGLMLSPFAEFNLRVEDVGHLAIRRIESPQNNDETSQSTKLILLLKRPGHQQANHSISNPVGDLAREIVMRHPALRSVEPGGLVLDRRTGEYLDREDLIRKYGPGTSRNATMSANAVRSSTRRFTDWTLPQEFDDFLAEISIHLIETQRLLFQRGQSDDDLGYEPSKVGSRRTIDIFAMQLAEKISQALAENSRISQKLDRSFPARLLRISDRRAGLATGDLEVRTEFANQAELRKRLTAVSVGDSIDDVPLPDRELKDWERSVMALYLQDSREKLASFTSLLNKLELLKNIIDSKFLFKELCFDASKGFFFIARAGGELAPAALSSGEQHELVLTYDLIFNVKSGDVVLIDEPEISLHVNWQKQFMDDLKRIAELVGVRFVIATHSPQIVGKYRDLMVALGPEVDS
ncbi:AAA family ATPase [Rhodococcus sp. BP-316]|uniref:AAA family ATPase n=1 Tax=Rhodococcus sp. BP-316 TaxID=2739445 RepID=UPI001C9B3D9A|nr:AAA family ATPase [Rhodococcus sp. BP-316]MBY6682346.1 AAA family ATPase [Rhodococcus sp. BP-316]